MIKDVNILSVLKRYLLNTILTLMRIKKILLNVMLYTSKKLSKAYYLKENFYEVMASTDYDTAKEHLTYWMIHAKNSGLPCFVSVI